MKKVRAILIGAGNRGADALGPYALNYPHELEIVAVAESNPDRRNKFAELHRLPAERVFSDWEELLRLPAIAEAAIICTQDRMHYEPTLQALAQGYHVLLEKPMSPDLAECLEMERAAERAGRLLIICHVLRYTAFW